jgi:hypothetical protein
MLGVLEIIEEKDSSGDPSVFSKTIIQKSNTNESRSKTKSIERKQIE